jgi:hypothetical protein
MNQLIVDMKNSRMTERLREKYNVDPKTFDLPLKKMTLNQQQDAHQQEIQQLKEENMQLGLEVIYIFFYSLLFHSQ